MLRSVNPNAQDFKKDPVWAEVGGKLADVKTDKFRPLTTRGSKFHISDLVKLDAYRWVEHVDNEHGFKFIPKF